MASGSGWNLWVWLAGGACGWNLWTMGAASGFGCTEVNRFPHITYLPWPIGAIVNAARSASSL